MSPAIETLLRLVAGVLLIGANAFFVAVEFALTRLRALDLDASDLEASPGLRKAWSMTERLEIHLTGCQLGISTSSVLLGVVAEPAVTVLIEPIVSLFGVTGASVHAVSIVVAVVVLNLLHKIWGEQAPTYLGVERPRDVSERLAPVLAWWTRIMGPVIRLGDGLAKATLGLFGVQITRSWTEAEEGEVEGRAELKRRMGELLSRAGLPEEREEEVLGALEIDEVAVREVMIPAAEMVTFSTGMPAAEIRRRIGRSGFVRYPVLREDATGKAPGSAGKQGTEGGDESAGESAGKSSGGDRGRDAAIRREDVVGIVYLPSLFDPPERVEREDPGLEEIASETLFLDAETSVADAIDELQAARQEVALVTAGEGGEEVVGIVTVSDAFERIGGEWEDPLD